MASRAVGAHGEPYLAQIGAKALCLLEETLEDLLEVQAVHIVVMLVMQASKTATEIGVRDAI